MTSDPDGTGSLATKAGGTGQEAAGEPGTTGTAAPEHPRGTPAGRWTWGGISGRIRGMRAGRPGRWPGWPASPRPLGWMTNAAVAIAVLFSVLAVVIGGLVIAGLSQQGVTDLHHAATVLVVVCVAIAVVLLLIVVLLALGLRMAAIRPLSRLAADARQVAGGDFTHEVAQSGPREVRELGADVNRMRERILRELSALQAAHANLEAQSRDLQRSNSELEQFAYVASHDLQEPLRKVASFCQLLQRNYAGQLDERADQYIGLAVDGAKRMQALINDLLSFSRVGRVALDPVPVSCAAALDQARANLSAEIAACNATIEIGALPVVQGEESLLVAVFQNLLSNALKFRGEQPPRVAVSARRDGETWLFSVTDNGIGIEPEFAERIFVIFQRLHSKDAYPGTGIGLAMCRKIIEYHGGRIWLDTSAGTVSRFCFTLPASPVNEEGR